MDKSSVIAQALLHLGERNYNKNSATASPVEQFYPTALRTCNAKHNWSFCRARAELTRNEDGTYNLPYDCLAIEALRYKGTRNKVPHWHPERGQRIHIEDSPAGQLELTYTTDLTLCGGDIPAEASPAFCHYVVLTLAAATAPAVIGGDSGMEVQERLEARAERACHQAIHADRCNYHTADQHPLRSLLENNLFHPLT